MYRIYRKNTEILITEQNIKNFMLAPGVLLSRIADVVNEETLGTLGPMVKRRGMPAEKEPVVLSKIWVDKDLTGNITLTPDVPVEYIQLPHKAWNC